jgi:hypothetical protein
VFSNLINLFKSAFRMIADGIKELLGQVATDEPGAEQLASKLTSAFVVATAVVMLFVPGLRQWADQLFRVGYQLWNHHSPLPIGKVV